MACSFVHSIGILGFRRSTFHPSLFFNSSNTLIIAAFVDNLRTFFYDPTEDKPVTNRLAKVFRMTDRRKIHWIVVIKVSELLTEITFNQCTYVQQAFKLFDIMQCQMVTTLLENHRLVAHKPGTATDKGIAHYQAFIRSIMYTALGTRQDIPFAPRLFAQC